MIDLRKNLGAKLKAVENIWNFYRIYFSKTESNIKQFDKYVILNIENTVIERVYAHIMFAMQVNGYKIYLVNNFKLFANLVEYSTEIASLPNLSIINNPNKVNNNALYIYDCNSSDNVLFNKVKLLENVLTNKNKKKLNIMPFPMIPRNYFSGNYLNANNVRFNKRNIGVYFSGNSDPNVYNHPIYTSFLHMMSRTMVIEVIKSELSGSELVIVSEQDQFVTNKNLIRQFVLYEWARKQDGLIIGTRTSNENWFNQLSKCNFFLGCPGYIQPLCHNLVEAMSVGTIPILEYREYFNPPLEDGVNCLAFSGKEELVSKIRQALRMSDDEIARMRANVIEYYEQYLSLTAVCSFLELSAISGKNVDLITSYNYEKQWSSGNINRY